MSHDLTTEQIDLLTSIMMAHEADPDVLTLGTARAIRQIGLTGPAASREARALVDLGYLSRTGPTIHPKPEAHAWWAARNGRSMRAVSPPEATPTPSTTPSLRERIMACVDEHPWCTAAQVCVRLDAARGSVAPALSAAAKSGSLTTVADADGLTLYARAGTPPPAAAEAIDARPEPPSTAPGPVSSEVEACVGPTPSLEEIRSWPKLVVDGLGVGAHEGPTPPTPAPLSGIQQAEALRLRAEEAELELFRVRSSLEASTARWHVPPGEITTLEMAQIIEARLTPTKGAQICYIAAPLSAATAREVRWNVARAQLLGEIIASRGCVPVVPHLMLAPLYLRDEVDADETARAAGLRACAELLRAVLAFGGVLHCLTRDDGSMSDGCRLEWELTPEHQRQSGTWDAAIADLRRRVADWSDRQEHLDRALALADLGTWVEPTAAGNDITAVLDSYYIGPVPGDHPAIVAEPPAERLRAALDYLTGERDVAQAEAERLRAELDATRSALTRMDAAAQLNGARSRNMCRTIRSICADIRAGRLAQMDAHDEVRSAYSEIERERTYLSVALGTLDAVAGPVDVTHG